MTKLGNLLVLAVACVFAGLLLEVPLYVAVAARLVEIEKPTYSLGNAASRFWVDIDPAFGVWHTPHSRYRHVKACFDVTYVANSHGARDRERSRDARMRRVVVLGDSFMEGQGVPLGQRLSDVLERETGVPHLNFGTAGYFGPTQYYLLYKTLAKQFRHDAVLVGLFPNNDFFDDDYEYGRRVHASRYRPYLVGEYPDYRLIYHRATLDQPSSPAAETLRYLNGMAREFSYTYNALRLLGRRSMDGNGGAAPTSKPRSFSGYYDFTDGQFDRMRWAIEQIVHEAEGRQVALFTIPRLADIERSDREGEPPLPGRLQRLSEDLGIAYVDLLPAMRSHTTDWPSYFLPCDGHWNAVGHRVAARVLEERLPLYTQLARRP